MTTETLPADLNLTSAHPWTNKETAVPISDLALIVGVARRRYGHDKLSAGMALKTFELMQAAAEFRRVVSFQTRLAGGGADGRPAFLELTGLTDFSIIPDEADGVVSLVGSAGVVVARLRVT